jgi:hypothetical protein
MSADFLSNINKMFSINSVSESLLGATIPLTHSPAMALTPELLAKSNKTCRF